MAQDGRTVGIMSPNGDAQADMFRRACEFAGVAPASVDFVEAHGTGTPTGDPIEVRRAGRGLRSRPPGGRTVPDRLGQAQRRPPRGRGGRGRPDQGGTCAAPRGNPADRRSEHADTAVDWADNGLRVPTEVEPWARTDGAPRRAAVCSYGYGGTIAHVLLEEAPAIATQATDSTADSPTVIPISARSPARLRTQAQALADHLRAGRHPIDRVAATVWIRRSHESVEGGRGRR